MALYRLLSKAEFDEQIKQMSVGRDYLNQSGSDISEIYPGWLKLILDLLLKIDRISVGSIDFLMASISTEFHTPTANIFHDCSLPPESGRAEALKDCYSAFKRATHEVCCYCGVTISDGVCESHNNIKSGRFVEDVVFGSSTEQNAGLSEITQLMRDALDKIRKHISIPAESVSVELQSLIFRAAFRSVPVKEFAEKKTELLALLEDMLKEKDEVIVVPPVNPLSTNPPLRLYNMAKVEEMWGKSQSRDRKQQMEPYYKRMKAVGETRYYAVVDQSWREDLERLAMDFPNFADAGVIDFLRQQFALAECGDGRLHFPPILLNGPAGVGKTLFAQTIATLAHTSYAEIHMEVEQNNSALAGSSSFWSNTQPGRIAEVLIMEDSASPIVVVDEVDKAMQGAQYNPISGLYGLLEPQTAKKFIDLSLGFPIDASGICWILTSNEIAPLPEPILSRVRVFDVKTPTREQVQQIARRIYGNLRKQHWGKSFEAMLPDDVAAALGVMEPRAIRSTILAALGNAAIEKRSKLVVEDMVDTRKQSSGARIGF